MLTSTVLGLITMVLFKPRSWCVYCPMGTGPEVQQHRPVRADDFLCEIGFVDLNGRHVLGLITMVLFKPRSWCVYCPMGTMTQLICKVKHRDVITDAK